MIIKPCHSANQIFRPPTFKAVQLEGQESFIQSFKPPINKTIIKFRILSLTLAFAMFASFSPVYGQIELFSTETWLSDDMTLPFPEKSTERNYLNGIRLSFEPQLGIVSPWGMNRLDVQQLVQIPKVGIETNLLKGYVGLQITYIIPTQVTFDEKSELLNNRVLIPKNGKVQLDGGVTIGLTFFNGILAGGFGYLNYDQRDFNMKSPEFKREHTSDMFGYLSLQPVAVVRSAIKIINGI